MLIFKEALLNETGIMPMHLPFDDVEEAKRNILKIGLQFGEPYMWYQTQEKPKKEFLLICIGTGHDHPELLSEDYIGSEIVYDGAFVWHYFLVDREELRNRRLGKEKKK